MKKALSFAGVALVLALGGASAPAQEKFPSHPVKVVVPYAPGGATDIVARLVGDEFAKITGQGFIVLNKPGAYGILAVEEMATSAPDGYTLMIGNVSTNAITPILYSSKFKINYQKDVAAVTNVANIPAFLVVTTKNFDVKSVAELIAWAKSHPGQLRYGTVGVGSYPHYDFALFAQRAGNLDVVGLPNKNGAAGVIQDMLRGDVHAAFLNVASTAGQIAAGNFRALAVVNDTRLSAYPNVPTMKEAGFPGVGTVAWQALFAPAATPKPVLVALHAAVAKALQSPVLVEKFQKQNFIVAPHKSVDEAQAWLAGEIKNWESITHEVKIDVGQ